jgi:hypothetical protein
MQFDCYMARPPSTSISHVIYFSNCCPEDRGEPSHNIESCKDNGRQHPPSQNDREVAFNARG